MKETSGESHQICDASVVSASSTDFAYITMLCLIASVSAAASRVCGATWVFGGSACFSAPAWYEIAVAAVIRTSPVRKSVRMKEIYTIEERARYRIFSRALSCSTERSMLRWRGRAERYPRSDVVAARSFFIPAEELMKRFVLVLIFATVGCPLGSQAANSQTAGGKKAGTEAAKNVEAARWEREAACVTIIRDDWGLAHVYGKTDADA